MARLWINNAATPEGKYLVVRRDGTIPSWPHFVLGARDPNAPAALRAYAIEGEKNGLDHHYIRDLWILAAQFEKYAAEHGHGDPDGRPHRVDDPATIEKMRTVERVPYLDDQELFNATFESQTWALARTRASLKPWDRRIPKVILLTWPKVDGYVCRECGRTARANPMKGEEWGCEEHGSSFFLIENFDRTRDNYIPTFKGPQPTANDLVEQATQELIEGHYRNLESYIKTYLELSGADIKDLELCEQAITGGAMVGNRYWLRPRGHVQEMTTSARIETGELCVLDDQGQAVPHPSSVAKRSTPLLTFPYANELSQRTDPFMRQIAALVETVQSRQPEEFAAFLMALKRRVNSAWQALQPIEREPFEQQHTDGGESGHE